MFTPRCHLCPCNTPASVWTIVPWYHDTMVHGGSALCWPHRPYDNLPLSRWCGPVCAVTDSDKWCTNATSHGLLPVSLWSACGRVYFRAWVMHGHGDACAAPRQHLRHPGRFSPSGWTRRISAFRLRARAEQFWPSTLASWRATSKLLRGPGCGSTPPGSCVLRWLCVPHAADL